ncbi:kinase-like domain-containing protein [Thelephora terrestris]|uniref:Kinase-like domain-containing protein n=1 Tax=Thelephora terrestris TaxID=56493 RepID=A0A9P6HLU2_9AGAM|nr:kinase-like domain-containing protein [Thelephora terrestris]
MAGSLSFEAAVKRIDEIAEVLANGTAKSKGKTTIELRRLCGHHHTVPTAYKLEGVVEQGTCAQRASHVTEIWKGEYNGEEVALKVLGVPQLRRRPGESTRRDEPEVQKAKSRFCKEVVLMKQVKHDNIVDFYGVSTTVSDFCLVFPWYHNGNIMDYLKVNPNTNRYNLLSGAVNGLLFLHGNRMVHGALRPSHILIDNDGKSRLSTGGRSTIVAVPNTSIADHKQSKLDASISDYRYVAPEIQWTDDYQKGEVLITKKSDVYEMAMVIYEVLSNTKPYSDCNYGNIVPKVQAGEMPERPPDGINDQVWELLEKCWSRDPGKRPPTLELYNILSNLAVDPQATYTTQGQSAKKQLPGKLKLQARSLKISHKKPKTGRFYVRFRYGTTVYKTSPTKPAEGSGEHTWFAFLPLPLSSPRLNLTQDRSGKLADRNQ